VHDDFRAWCHWHGAEVVPNALATSIEEAD
jgi:hypothetical protein